jgi:hypothetical protein
MKFGKNLSRLEQRFVHFTALLKPPRKSQENPSATTDRETLSDAALETFRDVVCGIRADSASQVRLS